MGIFFHHWRRRRKYHKLALQHLADLEGQLPAGFPLEEQPTVLLTAYNESARLASFFKWHRDLAVTRFIAIDNGSTDGSQEWLKEQSDTLTLTTKASYAQAGDGSWWFNAVLERMLPGQWVLVLDADECLVYEGMQEQSLRAFTEALGTSRCEAVFTPLLDLYPDGNISEAKGESDGGFLDGRNFFHPPSEYFYRNRPQKYSKNWSYPDLRGGPRQLSQTPRECPLLTKWSLFRCRPDRYVAGSHKLFPERVMRSSPSAALLHFKFSAGQMERLQSVVEEKRHGAFHDNYDRYLEQYREGCSIHVEGLSQEYGNVDDLKPFFDLLQKARHSGGAGSEFSRLDGN